MCELELQLKELRLPAICVSYREQADEARQESLSYEEYLESLVGREIELRHENRTDRWLRQSRLPLEKSLQTFDQSRLSAKVQRSVKSLLDGQFLEHAENVLAFGNPGSGKTHLLCAVAHTKEMPHRRPSTARSPIGMSGRSSGTRVGFESYPRSAGASTTPSPGGVSSTGFSHPAS